ncbi:MAG: DOMON domain-containing protein [Dehalococcoidales bacterium]|nr:DOMON domain-containing protein [Dehalococcoidales bacterium]
MTKFYVVALSMALSVPLAVLGVSCRGVGPQEPVAEGWLADGVITAGEYADQASYGDYEIYWRSDGSYLYLGIEAETTGWVAVGFQPGPLHRETDMVLGFVAGGEASVFDMFSSGDLGPCLADSELGGSDDIVDSGGREEGGETVIEFKRRLVTGDEYDGELSAGVNEIIWAYSSLDDVRQKHVERGHGEIRL